MYHTVNETAKLIAPLANVIASGIMKVYDAISFFSLRNEHKELMKIAKELKIEYRHESVEYISTLIKTNYMVQ